jgi:hypothetical protein
MSFGFGHGRAMPLKVADSGVQGQQYLHFTDTHARYAVAHLRVLRDGTIDAFLSRPASASPSTRSLTHS